MGQSSAAQNTGPAVSLVDSKPTLPNQSSSGSDNTAEKKPTAPNFLGPRPSQPVPPLTRLPDRNNGNIAGAQPYNGTDRNIFESSMGSKRLLNARAGSPQASCCARPVERVYCVPWCNSAPYSSAGAEVIDEPDSSRRQAYPQLHGLAKVMQHVNGMMTPTGGVYSGQIGLDGRPQGEGAQKYPDGSSFKGQWYEGAADGEGELLLPGGKGYSGSWKAGLKHGAGKEDYEHGMVYSGEFLEGQRGGQGTLTLVNGSHYSGKFEKGEFHGEGSLTWPDKRVYSGQWQSGLMHGFGTFDWPDGKSHSGHYQEDHRHGPGVFTWPDGSLCKGRWQDGKLHGSGTYTDTEGVSRHGRWQNGERLYWTK